MKYVIFILILFPLVTSAQLVEIGANAGIIPYSKYKAVDQPAATWTLDRQSAKTYSYGGRVGINFRKTQLGLAGEYQSIIYKSNATGTSSLGAVNFADLQDKVATSFISTYVFINKGWQLPRGYIYFGISGGYAMAEMSSYDIVNDGMNNPKISETIAKSKGLLGGGQLGYVLGIGTHLGLSFEVGLRYAMLKSDNVKQGTAFSSDYKHENTLLFLPTLIGLRYQIGRGCEGY